MATKTVTTKRVLRDEAGLITDVVEEARLEHDPERSREIACQELTARLVALFADLDHSDDRALIDEAYRLAAGIAVLTGDLPGTITYAPDDGGRVTNITPDRELHGAIERDRETGQITITGNA